MFLLAAIAIPLGLDLYLPAPEDNPLTAAKIELGRRLFFDRRLSRDGSVACASCHDPERAYSDGREIAVGVFGRRGRRNAPALINRGYGRLFFWDGRTASLEEQVLKPIEDRNEMDLTIARYATFRDLYQYCYRVASVVGLICLKIFGARAPEARTYAVNLGVAFQLTNILRDLKPDGERGRIYLPAEDLARFGYGEQDLLAGAYTPKFISLMEFECRRAQEHYHAAEAALPDSDRRALLPAEIMRAIYHTILERIEAARYQVFARRITLPPPRRLAVALWTWLKNTTG